MMGRLATSFVSPTRKPHNKLPERNASHTSPLPSRNTETSLGVAYVFASLSHPTHLRLRTSAPTSGGGDSRTRLCVEALEVRDVPSATISDVSTGFSPPVAGTPLLLSATLDDPAGMASLDQVVAWGDSNSSSDHLDFNAVATHWLLGATHTYAASGSRRGLWLATSYKLVPPDENHLSAASSL